MNSTELINAAKDLYTKLMHKDYDYRSFTNGIKEGYALRINEERKERKDHAYCQYCGRMLTPDIPTDANSVLVCDSRLCSRYRR